MGTVSTPPVPPPGHITMSVAAVSLSPSDYRMMSGDARAFKKPKSFPYIPGGDCSGIVRQVGDGVSKVRVGDRVIGTWSNFGIGALAQLHTVKEELVEPFSDSISFVDAAALADSAVNAMLAIRDAGVTKGQRVLVLGGTGGVGTALVQLLLDAEVSFLAATSTDLALLRDLGVHRPIDYRQEKWWEIPDFAANKFDHIFDCAEGRSAWRRCGPVLKAGSDGGRFCAIVPQEWQINIEHHLAIVPFIVPVLWRALWTSCVPGLTPRYRMLQGAPRGRSLVDLLRLVDEGRIRAIIDPHGPFPFTVDGVRAAFELHQSRRGKGKVVILVQQLEGEEAGKDVAAESGSGAAVEPAGAS